MRRRALPAVILGTAGLAACAASGREIYEGVRFYPRGEVEGSAGIGSFQDVPFFVSRDPDGPRWIPMDRLLAIRDELGVFHRQDDLIDLVYQWEEPHDTLGALRWERLDGRWNPSRVQRTIWESGGHAALLVEEQVLGNRVLLHGYVIRCRIEEGRPACE